MNSLQIPPIDTFFDPLWVALAIVSILVGVWVYRDAKSRESEWAW